LFPISGLRRLILVLIIIATLSYLVLNLVSFGGSRWITYVDVSVNFGLWRVCDRTRSGLCNEWSDDRFVSNDTNATFGSDKPGKYLIYLYIIDIFFFQGFIQSSQALEIISLIFYIIAAVFIIIGILDLDQFPLEIAFILVADLLFLCSILIKIINYKKNISF
jgi:hypothetical protein